MTQRQTSRVAVTVIVPCFCCAKTLARAIASVAEQTTLPQQVILVDDGSLDEGKTLAQMQDLQNIYAGHLNIEITSLIQNQGVASARNAGWKNATQPYIAFLDADDAWHPRKLEIQFALMSSRAEIALSGHRHRVLRPDMKAFWEVGEYLPQRLNKLLVLLSNPFITPSVMIRTDVPFRFEEGKRHMEDHLLWMEIVSAGASVVLLEADLAATYKRPFVESGLSADLWSMELAELDNYRSLSRKNKITGVACSALMFFSLLKYFRRVAMTMIYRLRRRISI
jgi:glycosyltransferase involved in cell wall biosynthesis